MNPIKAIVSLPARLVLRPAEQWLKRKFVGMLQLCLEPVKLDLALAHAKMDRILDINVAPDVLRDFRIHNETLRAIQKDSDLVREQNPLFNAMMRDLARIERRLDEVAEAIQASQVERDAA